MEGIREAFTILYLISSSDGEVSSPEINLIMGYLKKHQAQIDFDHREITGSLIFLGNQELLQKLKSTAQKYKTLSTDSQRRDLLKFGLKLVMSDGRIATEEIRMFNILGQLWEIDIDKFVMENH